MWNKERSVIYIIKIGMFHFQYFVLQGFLWSATYQYHLMSIIGYDLSQLQIKLY